MAFVYDGIMALRKILFLLLLHLLPVDIGAQAIDNTFAYKQINSDRYFRLNYENDFFSATDKYYTQGIHIEQVAPSNNRFFLSRLLIRPSYSYTRSGLALAHDGYTPTSISNPHILFGDRPFAGCLYLQTFLIATDTVRRQRFSTTLSTGVIGQAAGAMEMQTAIHRWLNNITPHGWPNQVHNDAILNYQVNYEKQFCSYGHIFALNGDAMARAGTLSDKAGIGSTLMLGYFDSPFGSEVASASHFRIYAYERPEVDLVGFDATLEGGVFNRTSPYTIDANELERITFQNRFGFVVAYRSVYLEYFQSLLSSEFKTGNYHVWGGVQIAFGI